jgi:hypothetical protein
MAFGIFLRKIQIFSGDSCLQRTWQFLFGVETVDPQVWDAPVLEWVEELARLLIDLYNHLLPTRNKMPFCQLYLS